MTNNKPVLLVEDDQVDAMTVKRAIRQIKLKHPLIHAENGEEALEYLSNESNEKPWIILLDLNMPRMNGLEFLQIAKRDEVLKSIPVVVLTTSKEQQDRIESFNFSVAGYMIKPVDYAQFVDMMQAIKMYWTLCQQPD
jgi:CheY-like chemotaxis protein